MKITPRHRRLPHRAWSYALLLTAVLLLAGGVVLAFAAVLSGLVLVAFGALLATTIGSVALQRAAYDLLADHDRADRERHEARRDAAAARHPSAHVPDPLDVELTQLIRTWHDGQAAA